LYELPPSYERLQREALDKLPYSGPEVQELQHELEKRLAGFFDTDCCFLTSTGFGSNVLGFPGILSKQWMLIMDEKCHNSMFTGSFLSDVGARKRFKHNDMADLENLLEATSGQDLQVMVGVEGIYR
jgi:7-keto-8-aminopelargonate synthetase-like enzyme